MSNLQQRILAYLGQARDLIEQGDSAAAISLYQEMLRLDPANTEVCRALAVVLEKQGDAKGAIVHYVKAIKAVPRQPAWVYFNLGKLLTTQNRTKETVLVYQQALKFHPENASAHRFLAAEQEKEGELEDAIEHYRRSLEIMPQQSVGTYFRLGKLLSESERFEEATEIHQQALQYHSEGSDVYRLLAVAQERQEQFSEAIASYRRAIAIEPQQPIWVYLNLSRLLNDQDASEEAVYWCHEAIRIYPERPEASRALALLQEQAGDIEGAIASYRRLLELDPQQPTWLYWNLGKVLRDQERWDEVIALYQQAVAVYPDQVEVYRFLGDVQSAAERWDEAIASFQQSIALDAQQPPWVYWNLGRALREQDRLEEVIALYQNAVRIYPDRMDAHQFLGEVLNAVGRTDEAIASFQQSIALDAQQPPWVYWNLGRALREQERLDEVITLYQNAAQLYPDSVDAHRFLGEVLNAVGRTEEAIASFQHAIALDAQQPPWVYWSLGRALRDQERLDEVIALYQNAVQLYPDSVDAHRFLGEVLNAAGQPEAAIASYRQALHLNADSPAWVYFTLGNLLTQQEQFAEAITLYQQALQFHSDHAEVYRQLGTAQKQQGDENGAIASYQRAIELNPDSPAWVFFTLGQLLSSQNQLPAAIHLYEEAIRVEPENPEARRLLGVVQDMAGQVDGAIASYQQSITMQPDGPLWVYYTLGQSLMAQERYEEAIEVYDGAVEFYPDDAELYRQMALLQKKRVMQTAS